MNMILTASKKQLAIYFLCLLIAGTTSCAKKKVEKPDEKPKPEPVENPIGTISTTKPIQQFREGNTYNWQERHQQILYANKNDPPKIVFLGNSLIHYWGGEPVTPKQVAYRGVASWGKYFKPKGVRNMAFSADRIEHVLWRVYNGELDGYKAEKVLMLIGTNNIRLNTDQEIITGLQFLFNAVKKRQPEADILLMGLLPRKDFEERIVILNDKVKLLANSLKIEYINTGKMFLQEDGKVNETLFTDGLHPNTAGYELLGPFLIPYLE